MLTKYINDTQTIERQGYHTHDCHWAIVHGFDYWVNLLWVSDAINHESVFKVPG
jgi:hypothetical protein